MISLKKIKNSLLILLVFIIFLSIFILQNLGQWLVIKDEPNKSDIIIVLTGSVHDRILQAVDLYHENYSNKIVLVNTYNMNYITNVEKGLEIPPGYAQLSKRFAINSGVPEKNIQILDGNARSTQDEALILREYIRHNKTIESIILVTSKYHSRRATTIFKRVLNYLDYKITVYSSPSEYDSFNDTQWWLSRKNIASVFTEYLKLAKFYFWDQFLLE